MISLGFGTAHADALDLVGEIQTPDGLKHSVYANYASRSSFASVTVPSDSTEQVRFAAFGQDLTLARDYTNTEDGLLAWHGTDGSGAVAVLIVEGTDVLGTIESAGGNYAIVPASGGFHEVLELDEGLFPSLAEPVPLGASGVSGASGGASRPAGISTLESAYLGWIDYNGDGRGNNTVGSPVTITVVVHYTDKAHSEARSSTQLVRLIEEKANRVYKTNDLPIEIDTVLGEQVTYSEGTKEIDTIMQDLKNAATASLRRAHANSDRNNADITMMLVKDNTPTYIYDDDNKRSRNQLNDDASDCNHIYNSLPSNAADALAVVSHTCVINHYATAAIGMIQGAGSHDDTSPEFDYAKGYLHKGEQKRTIAVPKDANCNVRTTDDEDRCSSAEIWSDPHRFFFGTRTQAGTVENWNARALFATGPHIASLKGTAENYDSTRPTGSIALPSTIPTSGSMVLRATFSEPIHERFPPNLTVTDGTNNTTATMSRVSDTVYTYSHRLDGETGKTQLLFSNARDRFGNLVVKAPTSGGSFTAAATNVADPSPVSGSLTTLSDEFDSRLTSRWTLSGDGNWNLLTPREQKVPDRPMSTNKVLSSEDCDDSCIATLRSSVSTIEPVTISFDRYVDRKIDRNEGLFLEYSADGSTWNTLASYTEGEDTSRWEREVVGLSVSDASVQLRFRAESSTDGEIIEVDNLRVSRPTHALPNISFLATLNDTRTQVSLVFSRSIPQASSASDFELVQGNVNAVSGSGVTRLLKVSEVPPGATAVVRYVGADVAAAGTELVSGTIATTNAGSRHPAGTHAPLSASFDSLSGWASAGAPGWRAAVPDRYVGQPPAKTSTNTVATAEDCDAGCTLTQTSGTNLSLYGSASLSLWRYVSSSIDDGEYLRLYISPDGGRSWNLAMDIGDEQAYGRWLQETVDMSQYLFATDVRLRLSTQMSNTAEDVAVDDIKITTTRAVPDTIPPSITAPAAVTAEATGARTAVSLGTAAATDAVDTSPTITNNAPVSGFPLGSTTVTWTATDDAGNSATAMQTVTVRDTTPPRLTAPASVAAEATGSLTTVSLGTAAATDAVDTSPTITNNAPTTGFPLGRTTVTWTATDDVGNSATATQNITIQDTTPPRLTAPASVAIEATGTLTTVILGQASASDLFGPVTVVNDAPSSFPLGRTTVTWTATDSGGNAATVAQIVTVRDTTAPSITPPAAVTAEATGQHTSVSLGTAFASDTVDSSPAVTNNAPASGFPLGRTTVIWTATDDSGNHVTATQTVAIADTTAPRITAPDDAVIEATAQLSPLSAAQYGTAAAVDIADPAPAVTHDAPSQFPLGQTTITWTATDSAGNSINAEQTVTVQDTTPPTLFVQSDIVRHTLPVKPVPLLGTYATDTVDSSVTLTNDAPPSFSEGLTTVTWTATDDSGNVSTGEQNVVMIELRTFYLYRLFDVHVKAPVVPAEVEFDLPLSRGNATAQTGCTPEPGSRFEAGTTLVTCVAVSASGRSTTALFRVIVEEDLGDAAIAIAAPPDVKAESSSLVALGSATAVSSSDTSPTITHDAPSSFPPGVTVVTWTTTDSGGNAATDTQTVTVTGPSQTILSETFDSVRERWNEYGRGQGCFLGASNPLSTCRVSWWQPTIYTNWRSGSPDNGVHPPGSATPNRVAEADGCHGFCVMELKDGLDMTGYGSAELSFWRYIDYFPTRTYNDPIGYLRLDILSDGSSDWKPLAIWGDMSEHAGQWHRETLDLSEYLTSSDFKIRFTSFTYNSDFGVMVDDLVVSGTSAARDAPPAVTVSDLVVVRGSSSTVAVSASDPDGDPVSLLMSAGAPSFVTFVDHGSGRGTLTAAPSASDSGSHIVTLTATASLLSSSRTLTVAVADVADTIPPTIVAPPDRTFEATGALTYANLGTPAASDQSGIAPTVSNDAPTGFALGRTTVTWTATDSAGNSASDTQHIVVRDTTPPRIETGPWGPIPYGSAFVHDFVAIDAVDGDLTGSVARTGTVNTRSEGNYPVSYSVSDSAGNSAQFSGILQVDDRHAPTVNLSGGTSVVVKTGGSFVDPGAIATDPFTNAAVEVSVGGDAVNTNVNGTYTVVYSAPDGRGNTGYAIRTVTVTPTPDSPPGIYGTIEHPSLQRASEFGRSIAVLDDGLVAIGAPGDSSRGYRGGVVYIFDSEDWSLVHTLRHLFVEGRFWGFGHKVTNAGDGLVAVSTRLDYTRYGPGVSVHIYNAETGAYVRDISGPPHALFFGSDLGTLENGNLVIGSRHEGIGPGQYSGVVYVYTSSGTQVHKIVRPDRMDNGFGAALTVLKNDILVSDYLALPGALYRYSGETGNLVHTYTTPSSLSPAPASFGSPVATNESGHFITSAWFKENTEPPYGSSHLYDAQNRLTMILPTELKDVYRFGASVGMTDDTIAIEASSSRSYGGLFHGHILMFDKDDPTRPFAGIPRAILQSDRPNMVPFGDNDMLLQAAWPPPLPNSHIRNSLVYLVNMQSPAPAGGAAGSSTAADGVEGAGAEPKALEQTEPVGMVPPTGGASPARFMPALLGFQFTDSPYDSAPDPKHAYMALRFTSSLDGLPVYPSDFEVTGKDGAWPLVLDVVAAGNTATLVLDRGSLYAQPRHDDPDPDDFEVLVRAPWTAVPTDPADGSVEILGIDTYSDGIMLHWNMFGDNTEYKAVIAPASSPRSKTADIATDTDRYMFVNLEPDTEYEVRVGVRGDDTTQSVRSVTTMPEGASPFLADLYPSVSVAGDMASLQWLDVNGVGEGRYRVERSVDGGPFAEIENQPGDDTTAMDSVDPEWRGKQVSYRVFEWVGNQKLYSDAVSFMLR